MSEKLCTLRTKGGGGGKYTETSLWTNSAPTSTFAGQEVTLSDDIDNYKYIAIRYKYANSTSDTDNYTLIADVTDFKKGGYNTSVTRCGMALDYISGGNANYARQVFYVSSTKIRFDIGRQFGGTNSSNANAIPLEILGLNELDHGTRESSLGTLTYQTSSNFKVTLGFKPKALQVFMRGNDSNTITLQYDENISTTKYVRNYTGSSAQSGWQTIGSTTSQRRLWSIDDDGFTLTPNTDTSTPTIYYSAVGDV